jgi:hypothetical protein
MFHCNTLLLLVIFAFSIFQYTQFIEHYLYLDFETFHIKPPPTPFLIASRGIVYKATVGFDEIARIEREKTLAIALEKRRKGEKK